MITQSTLNQSRTLATLNGIISGARRLVLSAGLAVAVITGATGALTLTATESNAQIGMRFGGGGMGDSPITKRSIQRFAKSLGLDDEQKENALNLLEGYQSEHKAATEEMQAGMQALQEKFRDEQDFTVFQKEAPKLGEVFKEKTNAAEKKFFDDLKLLCTDKQIEKWPSLERQRRREKGLKMPMFSGSAMDVISMVDRANVGDKPEVQAALNTYETEMDKLLQDLERVQKDWEESMTKGNSQDMFDPTKLQERMKPMNDASKKIRDLNRDTARKVGGMLEGETKTKFEDAVNRQSFPRIYRTAHVMKQMDAAMDFKDLPEDKKAQLKTIKESYTKDAAVANQKWAEATMAREEKAGGTMGVMMTMWGGGDDDPTKKAEKEARDDRKKIDDATKKRVEELLSEEQRKRLPAREPNQQNPWMDFMPDEEDEGK